MTGKPRADIIDESMRLHDDDDAPVARLAGSGTRSSTPRLWQRVRHWLHRSLGTRVPRPMPILLEDLYPPPARSVYRSIRVWETNVLAVLDELAAREPARAAALAAEVQALARAVRRHLLLVQRLRHVVTSVASDDPQRHALHALWLEHRVAWSGGIASTVDQLGRASQTFIAEPSRASARGAEAVRRACDDLRDSIDKALRLTLERNLRVEQGLERALV